MLTPKIYAVCLVKNEDDIIAQTLTYALTYCTKVFVVDNGSTDNTWDIVKSLSKQRPNIVPFVQTDEPFSEGLRGLPYNKYRTELSNDDWWLILDADEFLAEDPKPAIQRAMSDNADTILSWEAQFFFTDLDYQAWLDGKDSREIPIFERRRHYIINWRAVRLFRNDPARRWAIDKYIPDGLRKVHSKRILHRHYQYRDPEQIQKRLSVRYGHSFFPHVTDREWQRTIVSAKKLNYYDQNQPFRYSASGLMQYYGFLLKSYVSAAAKRLRHSVSRSDNAKLIF